MGTASNFRKAKTEEGSFRLEFDFSIVGKTKTLSIILK